MKILKYFFVLLIVFQACSIQKRHYTKGFYVENATAKLKVEKTAGHSFQEKLRGDLPAPVRQIFIGQPAENNSDVALTVSKNEKISLKHRGYFHSIFPKWERTKHDSTKHEIPDPSLNRVAKAGFRMSMYSLVLLSGALYLFFQVDALFYIILGVFIVAFIFALVSLLTSVAAGKDRVATNRKGLRFSRFGIIMSLLIFAAIASFFIFAPLIF